jgi:hypothetical protein
MLPPEIDTDVAAWLSPANQLARRVSVHGIGSHEQGEVDSFTDCAFARVVRTAGGYQAGSREIAELELSIFEKVFREGG